MKQSSVLSFFKKGSVSSAEVSSSLGRVAPTLSMVSSSCKRPAEEDAVAYSKQQRLDYELNKRERMYKKSWEEENPWLAYDEMKDIMWCTVCYEFRHLVLEIHPNENMSMVDGSNQFRKQVVLRHGTRKSHIIYMSRKAAKANPADTPLAKIQRRLNAKDQERFRVLFNSAHCTAKQDWSLNSFKSLIELQAKNGLYVGENYWTNLHGPKMFLQHIAYVQRLSTKQVFKECRFFQRHG